MTTANDTKESGKTSDQPSDSTDAKQSRAIEFTIAISSDEYQETTDASMLEALTSYRERKLN